MFLCYWDEQDSMPVSLYFRLVMINLIVHDNIWSHSQPYFLRIIGIMVILVKVVNKMTICCHNALGNPKN